MKELSIFENINELEINDILKSLGARRISFKKDHIILSSLYENDLIGIVLSGTVTILKYDYFGNRYILDDLDYNSMFGRPFLYMDKDISVVAATDCEILFLDYDNLLENNIKYEKIKIGNLDLENIPQGFKLGIFLIIFLIFFGGIFYYLKGLNKKLGTNPKKKKKKTQ